MKSVEDTFSKILAKDFQDDEWEEFEDDSETGICLECLEHSTPVYQRHIETGEKEDPVSNCCGGGIELP